MNNSSKMTNITKYVFFYSIFLIVGLILFSLPRLTIPLAVAYVLYLVVEPMVPKLIKLGLSRTWSILILFVGILFFTSYPIVKFVPSVKNEVDNFQYYRPKVERFIESNYESIRLKIKESTGYDIGDKVLDDSLTHFKNGTRDLILQLPNYLASLLEWVFLVPLFLFFMIKDGRSMKFILMRITPNGIFERFYYLFSQFNKKLGDYIFAKFIEASIIGVIITTGLLIIDLRFAFLLGLIAAITNIVPYVGPLIGSAPGIILALIEFGNTPAMGAVVVLYLVANIIDLALVFPILVSKIVDLHPMLVVVSVILGSQYLGTTGMIVSIPLAAALKLLFIEIYKEVYGANAR